MADPFRQEFLMPFLRALVVLTGSSLLTCQLVHAAPASPDVLHETAELVPAQAGTGDLVGWSVDVDGDTVVVGDWITPGAVDVFTRTDGGWTQQAHLVPVGATHDHGFGRAVAVSGDTLVAGAQGEDLGGGAFYVFQRTGTTWDAGVRRTIPGAGALGCAVAIEGDRMAIGAFDDDASRGAVFVLERLGTDWVLRQKLDSGGIAGIERLGSAVALQGDRILAGAPSYSDPAVSIGRACLFVFDGLAWNLTDVFLSDSPLAEQQFGSAVALDGDRVAIGAPAVNVALPGAVHVFSRTSGTWSREAHVDSMVGNTADRFGSALALSGDRLVVGAHLAGAGTGGAWVFERDAGLWPRTLDLVPSAPDPGARFGLSVALSGSDAVVGAPYGAPSGSAFVFDVGPSATFTYCIASPNVTGLPGLIGSSGSASIANDDLVLFARNLPPRAFGLFLCGTDRAQIAMATGYLCVSPYAPGIVRVGPVEQADDAGFLGHALDLEALQPAAVITAGSTWYFQLWYRNAGPGGYDLSDGLGVTFAP